MAPKPVISILLAVVSDLLSLLKLSFRSRTTLLSADAAPDSSSMPITIAGENVPWFDYHQQQSVILVWDRGDVLGININHMPTSTLNAMLGSLEFTQ
jgi:hypothetical protein